MATVSTTVALTFCLSPVSSMKKNKQTIFKTELCLSSLCAGTTIAKTVATHVQILTRTTISPLDYSIYSH